MADAIFAVPGVDADFEADAAFVAFEAGAASVGLAIVVAAAACPLADPVFLLAGALFFLAGPAFFLAGAVFLLAGALFFLAGTAFFLVEAEVDPDGGDPGSLARPDDEDSGGGGGVVEITGYSSSGNTALGPGASAGTSRFRRHHSDRPGGPSNSDDTP